MKRKLQCIIGRVKCLLSGIQAGKSCYIGYDCKIKNKGFIIMHDEVRIRPGTHLYSNRDSSIILEDNVEIGRNSTISSHHKIVFGKGVLTGPHVFIADHNHEYIDPDNAIYKQGIRMNPEDVVIIGDGSWLGTNVVIAGNVKIGKNCVIGANSVVTKDIPDYCVAVGAPAKIIKRYDVIHKKWLKVL